MINKIMYVLAFTTLTAKILDCHQFYSIGGGFILCDDEVLGNKDPTPTTRNPKFEYHTAVELINICETHNRSIAEVNPVFVLLLRNRCKWRTRFHTVKQEKRLSKDYTEFGVS